jgi:hypothetical protein
VLYWIPRTAPFEVLSQCKEPVGFSMYNGTVAVIWWWNPGNSIKQSIQQARKEGKRERGTKFKPKEQNVKWVTKGHRNKSCSKAPATHKEHIRKRKGWKPEKVVNLNESSPTTTVHLKIEVAPAHCDFVSEERTHLRHKVAEQVMRQGIYCSR